MILHITSKIDPFVEKEFKQSMKALGDFFNIKWVRNIPKIFILDSRKTIDNVRGEQTERWEIGWANGNDFYLLDRKKFKTESSHKNYGDEKYKKLIRHELSHLFYKILTNYKKNSSPVWLDEGLAIHLSKQDENKMKPNKLSNFLKYHNTVGQGVYLESGMAIKVLVEKFGKEKLLKLIKGTIKCESQKDFKDLFFKIYKSKLTYGTFNKWLEEGVA